MAFSCHPLTLFHGLNDSPFEITSSFDPRQSAPVPISVLSFPVLLVKQLMVVQSDVDANHFTLKSYVETVVAVSILSHRL
ncbi:hypothetical protein ACSBR1_008590 [Camellia fascicularis]